MQARSEILIRRTPDEVYDCWADLASWAQWNSRVERVDASHRGGTNAGLQFRVTHVMDTLTYEITEANKPARFVVKVIEGGVSPDMQYSARCEPQQGATLFINEFSVHLRGARQLLAPLLAAGIRKRVRSDARDLKVFLES